MEHPQIRELLRRYPMLAVCGQAIETAFDILRTCFAAGGKLLVCGNGGSAADAEHIVGELMKGFQMDRPLSEADKLALAGIDGQAGALLASRLQQALPALSLTGAPALSTAVANDMQPELGFAQQVWGYGRPGDVLLCISTSGNAKNVYCAMLAAKAKGLKTIGLTGRAGGLLAGCCDAVIRVPEVETYRVQELHLPVYHTLCRMLEAHFFGDSSTGIKAF